MAPRPAAPAHSPANPAEQAGTVEDTEAEHTSPRTGSSALGRVIPKPLAYNGRSDVLLFIFSLTNYFRLVALAEAVDMNDEMRILLTGMFLTDAALTWYRANAEKHRTFESLCNALSSHFGDKNIEASARNKLERLKQSGSVTDYVQAFQEIGILLSTPALDFFDSHEAHHCFTRNLHPDIKTAVAMAQKGSKNCREAILLATEFDSARRSSGASSSRVSDSGSQDRKVKFNAEVKYNSDKPAYQGFNRFNNNNRFNTNQRFNVKKFSGARVNQADMEQPRRTCWNCGSPDHLNDTCPHPPKNARLAEQRRAAQRK